MCVSTVTSDWNFYSKITVLFLYISRISLLILVFFKLRIFNFLFSHFTIQNYCFLALFPIYRHYAFQCSIADDMIGHLSQQDLKKLLVHRDEHIKSLLQLCYENVREVHHINEMKFLKKTKHSYAFLDAMSLSSFLPYPFRRSSPPKGVSEWLATPKGI